MMTTAKITFFDRLSGAFKMWRLMKYLAREQAVRTEALEELMAERRTINRG